MANSRGPLPKKSRLTARKSASAAVVPSTLHPSRLPALPEGLGSAGAATWKHAWGVPWAALSDRPAIENLCQLEDERAMLRAALDAHGAMLAKPIVSPKGDVVGEELYVNPVVRDLRRTDAAILALRDRLGLSPLNRARLGVAVIELEERKSVLERLYDQQSEDGAKIIDLVADDG